MATFDTTFYSNLILHNSRYAYKRGAFKGDSPADKNRRSRNWHRVEVDKANRDGADPAYASVIFHRTPIITATPDGEIELRFSGYVSAPTTIAAFNFSTRQFNPGNKLRPVLTTIRKCGVSTPSVYTLQGWTPAYEGMRLDADGKLLTEPHPFMAKRLDKDKVSLLNCSLSRSGFKELFPMMYIAVENEDRGTFNHSLLQRYRDRARLSGFNWAQGAVYQLVTETEPDEEVMTLWRGLIATNKFEHRSAYDWNERQYKQWIHTRTRAETWTRIMSILKEDMYTKVSTEQYFVSNT